MLKYNSIVRDYLKKNLGTRNQYWRIYNKIESKLFTKNILIKGLRIYLTEECNASCNFCFNKKLRSKKRFIDTKKLEKFNNMISNKGSFGSVRVMGGEPTLHPEFLKIYTSLKYHYKKIILFTNAINDVIFKLKPRLADTIIFNFYTLQKQVDVKKFLPSRNFHRGFETIVNHNTDMNTFKEKIKHFKTCLEKYGIHNYCFYLSPNLTENIFKYKKILNDKFEKLILYMQDLGAIFSYDHLPPLCFFEERVRKLVLNSKNNSQNQLKCMCSPNDSFNMYPDFTLYYCNQYPYKIGNIFDINGNIMPYDEIISFLKKAHIEKEMINYLSGCKDCENWFKYCNGGCWKHRTVCEYPFKKEDKADKGHPKQLG